MIHVEMPECVAKELNRRFNEAVREILAQEPEEVSGYITPNKTIHDNWA